MLVYFFGTAIGDAKFLKIGKAARPAQRLIELQVGCPAPLTVIATVNCADVRHATAVEKLAHSIFDTYWVRGEWFKLPEQWQELVNLVKEHADFHFRASDPDSPRGCLHPFLTLQAWGKANGLMPMHNASTLRRLAKAGVIVPKPVKRGSAYYVHPKATLTARQLFSTSVLPAC